MYRRSIAILEEALGPDHLKVAVGLQSLAKLYYKIGKYDEAESLYNRALQIQVCCYLNNE